MTMQDNTNNAPSVGIHEFQIYYEPADEDTERVPLGKIRADTMGDALEKAAQYWEYPSHDLVAVQLTKNTLFNPLKRNQ